MQRYSITACTAFRQPFFAEPDVASETRDVVVDVAQHSEFDLIVYCFMPDHLHLLLSARSDTSDLERFMKLVKQKTGFTHKQDCGKNLWQPGYYDRVLRGDEDTLTVARYILENPVRAGLATRLREWPLAGSPIYTWEELMTAWDKK
jgi:REP element-mobilizing transposase RayT